MSAGGWWQRHAPAKGPQSGKTLRERIDTARLSVVKAGKQSAATVHRVAAHGMERAKMGGAKMARHIVYAQKAAGVTAAMMRESARSVAAKPMALKGDAAWQQSYVREAERLGALPAPQREPAMTAPAAVTPERPSWPHINPSGPDREAAG